MKTRFSSARKAQGALALVSFLLLVGHKGDGCQNTVVPPVCDDSYNPVCGDDGATYANDCEADSAGVVIAHDGECSRSCEPGYQLQTICEEIWYEHGTTTSTGVGGGSPSQPPYEFECYDYCVPDDPCGPNYHEEWVCSGSTTVSVGVGGSDSSTTVGVGGAGGANSSATVGVGGAGGSEPETATQSVGVGGAEPTMPPHEDDCYFECVPNDFGEGTSNSNSGGFDQ